LDLRRQIAIIRAWFPLLVACVVLAAGTAFVFSSLQQKLYEAKATLIVGQSLSSVNPSTDQLLASQRLSTTYASVVTTRPVLNNVITKLGLDVTADQLRGRVVADTPQSNTLLTITVRDTDPTLAAAIANALADQLIAASPAIQGRQAEFQASIDADMKATQDQINSTQAQVEALTALANPTAGQEAELATLDGRLAGLRSTYATLLSYSSGSGSSLLSVIEPAVAPTSPVSPRPLLYTLLAATVGLLLGAAIAFVMEYLDDSVKDSDTVQEVTGLSTLGTISRMKGDGGRSEIYRIVTLLYPRSSVAEAYRTLRTNIEFASVDAPIRTLLVTSSISGEGKTVTAANLALVFAQAGRRVLLVDADLRKPGVHLLFDLPNVHGLTTLLRSVDTSLDAFVHGTEQENLRILTTGPLPPNPAELLGSQRMRAILDRLKASGDLVIFDSPPLQAVTDSAVLSSYLDATLFVIDAGRSHRDTVRQGREALARAGAPVLGVVLNRTQGVNSNYGGYYVDGRVPEAAADKRPPATEQLPKGSAS
jgi:succinoglycan biosynthesis transport protein ExoP